MNGRLKRVVLAVDDQGATVALGPVYTDDAIEKLRDQVEERDWENVGVVPLFSAAEFRGAVR